MFLSLFLSTIFFFLNPRKGFSVFFSLYLFARKVFVSIKCLSRLISIIFMGLHSVTAAHVWLWFVMFWQEFVIKLGITSLALPFKLFFFTVAINPYCQSVHAEEGLKFWKQKPWEKGGKKERGREERRKRRRERECWRDVINVTSYKLAVTQLQTTKRILHRLFKDWRK